MKLSNAPFWILAIVFFLQLNAKSQIETRLATNCAINNIDIPIQLSNLENIKAFQLLLKFDSTILEFDTSYHHFSDFEEQEPILVRSSNDTVFINWNFFAGFNLENDLLLSLSFKEIASGEAQFSWLEDQCRFTNIEDLIIPSDYSIDGLVSLPFDTEVSMAFEQFTTGCRDGSENGGCKAQAVVRLEGGTYPYQYHWYDQYNQKDSIAIGLCEDPISVVIKDAEGCFYAGLFDAEIYPAINPEDVSGFKIEYSPEEIFITKPYVEFSVDPGGTIIEKYEWNFGDSTQAYSQFAEHSYENVNIYPVSLRTENIDGCDTTIYQNIEVQELNFCIPNVFTPNGDGINDTWIFKLVGSSGESEKSSDDFKETGLSDVKKCSGEDLIFQDHFKSTQLVLYNRNGSKVFECSNCTENWDGGGLPDGVYFFVFNWVGEYSEGKEHGNVTILGSSN